MPSSDDGPPRVFTWTTREFADLVDAWAYALIAPRSGGDTQLDVIYRRFVQLQGGSSRRNKAALISKRSALKFSYLFLRDFDLEQRKQQQPTYFELPASRRTDVMKTWKQQNSSVVELTPEMSQTLARIVKEGGDDDVLVPAKARVESVVAKEKPRPKKKKQPTTTVRLPNPTTWSTEEMLQVVQAWQVASKTVARKTSTGEPLFLTQEMYKVFAEIQGGKPTRNESGLATRRRVLKHSFLRIQEFNEIQEMQGDAPFAELPLATRQSVLRSWKNPNLLDLPVELYNALEKVIPKEAINEYRRAKAAKLANPVSEPRRKPERQSRRFRISQEEAEYEEGSVSESSKWSMTVDSDEEKTPTPSATASATVAAPFTIASRQPQGLRPEHGNPGMKSIVEAPKPAMFQQKKPITIDEASTSEQANVQIVSEEKNPSIIASVDKNPAVFPQHISQEKIPKSAAYQDVGTIKLAAVGKTNPTAPIVAPASMKKPLTLKKRKKVAEGFHGKPWENDEIDLLVKAWEKAGELVITDPSKSLNKTMYHEFVAMQGGSSVRNITSLAARRSSLKFSYSHISSFNEAQTAKGEPPYHEIPDDTRMNVLRSWKNRNSVDLSKESFERLGRIIAMDDRILEARANYRATAPKLPQRPKPPVEQHPSNKTAKWTTEETFDLIKACADVMNVPTDKEQTATERESLIYDHFVARRQNAGDTDTPVRRDLRAMAQQWRYILSSYTYIKVCNAKSSEMDSASWFNMTSAQRRAYQQCTNVPLKFVDLDADMFALITETSFDGVVSAPLTSSAPKTASDGISLRPRETLKKTKDPYLTSDSESSVSFKSTLKAPKAKKQKHEKDPLVKKGNSWPSAEVWNLVQAWEEGSKVSNNSRLASSIEAVYEHFTKLQEGPLNRNRSIHSVRNKMIALKSSFLGVSKSIKEKYGDSSVWFNLTPRERMEEIRGWKNKTVMDLNQELYEVLERILPQGDEDDTIPPAPKEKQDAHQPGRPKRQLPEETPKAKHEEKRQARESRSEKQAVDWDEDELLKLAEACGELLEGRRTRRYLFEEEKDRFFRRYQELGGGNSLNVAVMRARYLMDSYEFIYAYNESADATNSLSWFELDPTDRHNIAKKVSKVHRNFNGLATVDAELFDAVDQVDELLRQKLKETKRKTYKPPTDGASGTSRYVDPDVVVQRCVFKKRPTSKKPTTARVGDVPIGLGFFSSSSSSSELSSESSSDDDSASDYRDPTARSVSAAVRAPSPRPGSVRTMPAVPSRKRTREIDDMEGSATLCITEIIQQQTQRLEQAVKRFRKDSSTARKEHHEFLLGKIQDSFPVDNGHGSYLERVADRQGQSLVEIFQRLQQQRETEKAKDRELMRELFGRSEA